MLRRIDWTQKAEPRGGGGGADGDGGGDEEEEEEGPGDGRENACHLVWEVGAYSGREWAVCTGVLAVWG
jgi:hypothetical protein